MICDSLQKLHGTTRPKDIKFSKQIRSYFLLGTYIPERPQIILTTCSLQELHLENRSESSDSLHFLLLCACACVYQDEPQAHSRAELNFDLKIIIDIIILYIVGVTPSTDPQTHTGVLHGGVNLGPRRKDSHACVDSG